MYKTEATFAIFRILTTIVNRKKLDPVGKNNCLQSSKAFSASCKKEDFAFAFLKLHHRIDTIMKVSGKLHEIDSAIGKEPEEFEEFLRDVKSSYSDIFNQILSPPKGESAESPSDSDLTLQGEPTVDSDKAKTSVFLGLASHG